MKIDFGKTNAAEIRAALEKHIAEGVVSTGDSFQQRFAEIKDLRASYADLDMPWRTPPRA